MSGLQNDRDLVVGKRASYGRVGCECKEHVQEDVQNVECLYIYSWGGGWFQNQIQIQVVSRAGFELLNTIASSCSLQTRLHGSIVDVLIFVERPKAWWLQ